MKNFDMQRFMKANKWLWAVNLNMAMKGTLLFGLAIFLMSSMIVGGFVGVNSSEGLTPDSSVPPMILVISFFYFLTVASGITLDMKSNQARINTMMLPASNLEKFLSRILFVTIGGIVSMILGLLCADILQMLISLVRMKDVGSLSVVFFKFIANSHFGMAPFSAFVFFVLSVMWFQSCYVLGGTFFRRNQWLLTTITGFCLSLLFMWSMVVWADSWSFGTNDDGTYTFFGDQYVLDPEGTMWMVNVIAVLLISFNYWLSYRLFCRMQVINNKWINL